VSSNARRGIWFGLAACFLAGCALADSARNTAGSTTHSGYYQQGFERSDFYPEDGGGPYWLTAGEAASSRIQEYYVPAPGRGGGMTVRLVIEGKLDIGGGFGHVGAYSGELTAARILEIEPVIVDEFDAWLASRHKLERR